MFGVILLICMTGELGDFFKKTKSEISVEMFELRVVQAIGRASQRIY